MTRTLGERLRRTGTSAKGRWKNALDALIDHLESKKGMQKGYPWQMQLYYSMENVIDVREYCNEQGQPLCISDATGAV